MDTMFEITVNSPRLKIIAIIELKQLLKMARLLFQNNIVIEVLRKEKVNVPQSQRPIYS